MEINGENTVWIDCPARGEDGEKERRERAIKLGN